MTFCVSFARRCHPDKQGSTEEFLKLQEDPTDPDILVNVEMLVKKSRLFKRNPPHNEGKLLGGFKKIQTCMNCIFGVLTFTFETFLSIWCRSYGRCFP